MRMRTIHSGKPGVINVKISEQKCARFIRSHIRRALGGVTAFAVFKYRAIKADGFVGFAGHGLGEHHRGNNHRPLLARWVGKNELPGYAVFISYPALTLTKR